MHAGSSTHTRFSAGQGASVDYWYRKVWRPFPACCYIMRILLKPALCLADWFVQLSCYYHIWSGQQFSQLSVLSVVSSQSCLFSSCVVCSFYVFAVSLDSCDWCIVEWTTFAVNRVTDTQRFDVRHTRKDKYRRSVRLMGACHIVLVPGRLPGSRRFPLDLAKQLPGSLLR